MDNRSPLGAVNLNRLVVFVAVVEAGSLSAAGRTLGLATMVSTHVARLEQELGVTLLVRTTRKLHLTAAGEAFFEASRRILRDAEQAIASASEASIEPRGTLRVTCPSDYGAIVVAPVAAELTRRHPKLRVDLVVADGVLDLVANGIDVAVRLAPLPDSSQRATRVGELERLLVASPRTLAEHGRSLRTPDDLRALPFVGLSILERPSAVTLIGPEDERASIRFEASILASTTSVVRAAVIAGAGLGVLPAFHAAEDIAAGRLVRVLPRWSMPRGYIHAVHPSTGRTSPNVRVFVDALVAAGRSLRATTESSAGR